MGDGVIFGTPPMDHSGGGSERLKKSLVGPTQVRYGSVGTPLLSLVRNRTPKTKSWGKKEKSCSGTWKDNGGSEVMIRKLERQKSMKNRTETHKQTIYK